MSAVSSKWYVTRIEGQNVYLSPVCRGIENREWASSTPGGSMNMYITNQAALDQFEVGQEYTGLFEHSPKPVRGDGHKADEYVDHPAYAPSKAIYLCKTCGAYAYLNEDGTPNWSRHDETYAAPASE